MKRENGITAIIACAGKGERSGLQRNKVFFEIEGVPALQRAAAPFDRHPLVTQIIFSANPSDFEQISDIAKQLNTPHLIVEGGSTRTVSVLNALKSASGRHCLIHDGARPYVSDALIQRAVDCLLKNQTAAPVLPLADTVATLDGPSIVEANRVNRAAVQTPQGFLTDEIELVLKKAEEQGLCFTDESGAYCSVTHGRVASYEGESCNVKLTYPQDFTSPSAVRVGTGFDLHRLVSGRDLVLGGIKIEHDKGLLGHSDADVLTHAVMDALLSALALRDIGYHFSDKDPAYKDISSMVLLERVMRMVEEAGYSVNNLSATVIAQKPKLAPYARQITDSLAKALKANSSCVGISFTTTEGVGIIGKEEAIAVNAYCSLKKIKEI